MRVANGPIINARTTPAPAVLDHSLRNEFPVNSMQAALSLDQLCHTSLNLGQVYVEDLAQRCNTHDHTPPHEMQARRRSEEC